MDFIGHLVMFAVWAALSLTAFGRICKSRWWRENKALTSASATVSMGAYLAVGLLVAPAYSLEYEGLMDFENIVGEDG